MGLDSVELVMAVEEHFEIEISNAEATEIFTVGQFRDIVCRKLAENGQRNNPEKILGELSDLISKMMAIPRNKISASSRFVQDLKID